MYQKYYSEFLKNFQGKYHFASHSHHFWPDVTRKATDQYWLDSSMYVDNKWNYFFENIVPKTKKHIATILNFSRPDDISFAPNTHELAFRLLSSLDLRSELKILTTDSEFHSFNRQITRLSEWSNIDVEKVPANELLNSLKNNSYDFIFVSQVFYNSSNVLSADTLKEIAKNKKEAIVCIDGYHAFAAIPTDISEIEDEIFYLGGSYKYAQGGEGLCFLTVPKNCKLRPLNTGWFSSFSTLESAKDSIEYDDYGMRFWGSTIDMTPFYRFNATWDLFESELINIDSIHSHVQVLQKYWIEKFTAINPAKLLNNDLSKSGHFLCYEFESPEQTKAYFKNAQDKGVLFDYRNNILRVGLGMYQSINYIDAGIDILRS
jgi:selenocysteine lyase/cysteine desulfurase